MKKLLFTSCGVGVAYYLYKTYFICRTHNWHHNIEKSWKKFEDTKIENQMPCATTYYFSKYILFFKCISMSGIICFAFPLWYCTCILTVGVYWSHLVGLSVCSQRRVWVISFSIYYEKKTFNLANRNTKKYKIVLISLLKLNLNKQ